jgi:hypothetical protein
VTLLDLSAFSSGDDLNCILLAALRAARHGEQPLALRPLASQLARSAHGFARLARPAFRGLFVSATALEFTEEALALKFLLQNLESLVDIVVADEDLQGIPPSDCGLEMPRGISTVAMPCPAG